VPNIFHRHCNTPGHIVASAMVCNLDGSRVLLNKHGITGNFINFGGHADGDEDLYAVALKELEEEAGITQVTCSGTLFDIDFHYMNPHMRKGQPVPAHIHCDYTWLFRVPDDVKWTISDESTDIRWFTLEEAMANHAKEPDKDAQMQRIYQKIAAGLR
jgi:8-oxo-dGTP pyrophosphatase MutT (NUDIX family)